MARATVFTIIAFFLHWQVCAGQQNDMAHHGQRTTQNNAEPANLNMQMQQSGKPPSNLQQSYNLQQLANIPMQTFNFQQPINYQQQANSPPLNNQPVNQAISQHQVTQSIGLQDVQQHDVQQPSWNTATLQQSPVCQSVNQQPPTIKVVQQPMNLQQGPPIQAVTMQQQPIPANLKQQPQLVANVQHEVQPQQCANLPNSVVISPGNLQQQQQQGAIMNANFQQIASQQMNLQQVPQPLVGLQQQQPAYIQQPAVAAVPTYQHPVTVNDPVVAQLNVQKQQLHSAQQMQYQQVDSQHHQAPCHNVGGYQVVSYQKPCQHSDITAAIPVSLQLAKGSSNPYPAVIAAVPATIGDSNKIMQRADSMYLVSPQSHGTSAAYTPILIAEKPQQVSTAPNIVPIAAMPRPNPISTIDFINNNFIQYPEIIDNQSSSLKTSELGILNALQNQFPIASMLNQPSSSIQSALLSSILSSIHSPSASSQYMPNYAAQAIMTPNSNSQNSKFSLKSLLPLLLNLLQEKYSGCGCQCHCCNCDRSQNDNVPVESPKAEDLETRINEEMKEETTDEPYLDNEESLEEEDIPIIPQSPRKSKYQNMISDDSGEVNETQDTSCENEDSGVNVRIEDEEEEELLNDSSNL